jgi:hypothetical protein
MSLIEAIRDVNKQYKLGWGGAEVRAAAKILAQRHITGEEPSFSKTVLMLKLNDVAVTDKPSVVMAASRSKTVGSRRNGPKLASGYECPRCHSDKMLSAGIPTARTQLPYCTNCRIVLVPAG